MSELRSVVEALRSETLPDLPDARIEEDFAELQRVCELLELERLDVSRRSNGAGSSNGTVIYRPHRGSPRGSGSRGEPRVGRRTSRGRSRTCRATRRALEAGDVSLSAARVLVAARDANPDAFDLSEDQLVDAARIHTINDLQRVASFWRQRVERDRLDDRLRARRRLHASVSFEGMVRVDGDLDPEAGETLLTALRAVMDAGSRNGSGGDDRTPPQRRADALHEICRQWLDLADRPTVAGERPHVTVTVDAPALAGTSSGAGDLDHVGAVDATVARQLSCDASVMRVVMAGRSEPPTLAAARRSSHRPSAER